PRLYSVSYTLRRPRHTLFPSTTLSRSADHGTAPLRGAGGGRRGHRRRAAGLPRLGRARDRAGAEAMKAMRTWRALLAAAALLAADRKSTRLNSSHVKISYAGFCLKKKR